MSIPLFVGCCQSIIFAFACVCLFSIWWRGYTGKRDDGVAWLGVACLLWSIMGVLQVWEKDDFRTILASLNTVCFLAAAAHLDVFQKGLPAWLQRASDFLKTDGRALVLFVVIGGVVMLAEAMPLLRPFNRAADFLIAIPAAVVLMRGLWLTFRRRGFWLLGWAAIVVLGLIVVSQAMELLDMSAAGHLKKVLEAKKLWAAVGDVHWIVSLSSKSALCLLFISLTFSWVWEQLEITGAELDYAASLTPPEDFVASDAGHGDVERPESDACESVSGEAPGPEVLRFEFNADDKERHRIVFRYDYKVSGALRFQFSNERLFLRVLELALARKMGENEGKILTKSLFPACTTTTDEQLRKAVQRVKDDFRDILRESRIDPLFVVTSDGRHVRLAAESIWIDPVLKSCLLTDDEGYWSFLRSRYAAELQPDPVVASPSEPLP